MKHSWSRLVQQAGGPYAVEDFERAAYRLMTEQVLYAHERGGRHHYHLVESYFSEFAAVFEPFGVTLSRNAHHRYIVARPTHADGQPVTTDETVLLLLLRHRYDEVLRQGQVEENGEVIVELPELQEAYQALTGRTMPDVGALRLLLRNCKRWSVAHEEDDPDNAQPFRIVVRPAITEMLGLQWLQRLAAYRPVAGGSEEDATDAPDADEAGEA